MSQYLGDISAYALAVSQGYTGTEEEYAELMASYATVGQTAVTAAQTATTKASEAATSATTATTKASEATTAATTATNKAAEAQADADAAALDASQAMSAASTATTKATEATTAAATAVSAKDDAVSANTAAQSAKTAAQTAQTGAETAAASVQSSAAQIQTNADDISELKEDLSESVTTSATLALVGSINSNGVIISASGFGCYKAKVKAGVKYNVISHDTSGLVCAFYYNEPAVGEASYNGSRIVSNDPSVVAPIDGWIAFRSAETKTDESITNVVANDYIARTDAKKNEESIDNYRKQHAYIPNINLYDESNLIQGYWVQSDGSLAYSASSYYALIPIVGGTDVAVCFGIESLYMGTASIGGFVEYDKDMNLIAVKGFGDARRPEDYKYNGSWVGRFSLEENTQYIAFTAKLSSTWDARTSLIVAYGEDLSTYSGQGDTMLSWDGFKFHSDAKWLGKKWCVVGDSLTAVNATADKKYYSLIQDNTGISVENVAVSGSGYAKKASSNESFVHQVQSIPNDTDVVTVFGSGNDNTAELQLGSITDSGTTTLCGCVNTVIDYMIANHPTVAFGIITPTPWANWEPSDNLYWMAEYSEAIVKICNRRGVPCLNLYHCSNLHPSDASFNAIAFYNADGTHPNNVGHAIIAPRIEAFLDSLI